MMYHYQITLVSIKVSQFSAASPKLSEASTQLSARIERYLN